MRFRKSGRSFLTKSEKVGIGSGRQALHGYRNTGFLAKVEEGADTDGAFFRCQTRGELLVGFLLVVSGVESAQTLEIGAPSLSQLTGESEGKAEPILIVGCYVRACRLDALGYNFDVAILQVLGNGDWG